MCTYSNKTKNTCQKFVLIISLIMGLMGLVTLGFGLSKSGTVSAIKEMGFKSFGSVTTGTLILGLLIILTGILGCLTAKFKNPCFAIPYGLLASIFGLILLIIGFTIMAATSPPVLKQLKQTACAPSGQLLTVYRDTVDKTLCSEFCPCDESMKEKWSFIQDDAKLRTFGRTLKYKGQERSNYIANGNQAKIVAMTFAAADDTSNKVKTVSTFAECYKKNLAENATNKKMEKVRQFVQKGGFKSLQYVEENYMCASFCQAPLFYITKDFTETPTRGCLDTFVDEVAGSQFRPVAIVAIITSLIALCGCCGSFPLCTKYHDEEEEK